MLPCAFPARSIFPLMPCGFPARSLFPMLPCAFPTGEMLPCLQPLPCPQRLPDGSLHRHFRWQLLPDAAAAASAGASPAQQLPHGGNPRSGNLFRTDFRFAPSSRSASLAGPSIHEGMDARGLCGRVPDSAGSICLSDC